MNPAFSSSLILKEGKKNQSSCLNQVKSALKSSFLLVFCPHSTEVYKVLDCGESLTVVPVIEKKESPLAPIYILTKQNPTLQA